MTWNFNSLRKPIALALMLSLGACQQSAPPASTPAAAPAMTATADSVGIPECDDYLTKYQACVSTKAPEAARAMLKQSLDQTRAAWKNAMSTPGGKDALASACKQAHETTKASMAAYGCTDF